MANQRSSKEWIIGILRTLQNKMQNFVSALVIGPSVPSSARIRSIDSLRAIAALIVVYSHTWATVAESPSYWGATGFEFVRRDLFQNGHLGVTLFFIISGYVIPNSLISHQSDNLRKFAISRFMRLYPAYWLSIAATAVLVGLPDDKSVWINLTMLQRLFGVTDLLGIYWTLFVELAFYGSVALLFAAGLLGAGRKIDILMAVVVSGTVLSAILRGAFDIPLPAGNFMFLCLMFFGAWLRLSVYEACKLTVASTFFLLSMLFCAYLLYYPDRYNLPWHLHYAKFFLAVVIFICVFRAPRLASVPLAYLGTISYSIYLFHQPIFSFISERVASDGLTGRLVLFVVTLFATLIVSALIYHAVERPFITLGRLIGDPVILAVAEISDPDRDASESDVCGR